MLGKMFVRCVLVECEAFAEWRHVVAFQAILIFFNATLHINSMWCTKQTGLEFACNSRFLNFYSSARAT